MMSDHILTVVHYRRELGTLRALPTSRRQLRAKVICEAVALIAVGSLIGPCLEEVGHSSPSGS
jgi:hypothetical protein